MNRRFLLAGAAATPALAAPALAQTLPEIRWRLTSSFPRNLDILYFGAEQVAKRVGELTDGRFRISAFPAGEIVPGLQVLDAVSEVFAGIELVASRYADIAPVSLAAKVADAGKAAEILIFLRDGSLAGRFVCPAA